MAATKIKLSKKELAACDEIWHQLRPQGVFYGR
jgi:hypothetical protein